MTTTVSDALSLEAWRTIRLALSQAMIVGHITEQAYERAMTEVMGTPVRNLW
jgi:hypothetical protein